MHTGAGPQCLSLHVTDVQACTGPPSRMCWTATTPSGPRRSATGSRYIDTVPWFCTKVCSDVIGHYQPYWNPAT